MLVYQGYKIIGDMTKLVFYLFEHFTPMFDIAKQWPASLSQNQIHVALDWYTYKFKPFMYEFYVVMDKAQVLDIIEADASSLNGDQLKAKQLYNEYIHCFFTQCEYIS